VTGKKVREFRELAEELMSTGNRNDEQCVFQ
jgi:hypothetical protein